jgi:hypothetical protein
MKHATDVLYLSAFALIAYAYNVKDQPITQATASDLPSITVSVDDTSSSRRNNSTSSKREQYYISFDGLVATTKKVSMTSSDATTSASRDTILVDTRQVAKGTIESIIGDDYSHMLIYRHNLKRFFDGSDKQLQHFCLYVKTQSNGLDDDNWVTIRVMLNRFIHHECTWQQYYDTRSINNSNTIRTMRNGTCRKRFSMTDEHDSRLYEMVVKVVAGQEPIQVPLNVLYFESHKSSPNRGVHKLRNLWHKYRHKFYVEPDVHPTMEPIRMPMVEYLGTNEMNESVEHVKHDSN